MKTDNILIAEFYTECEFEDRGNGWYSKVANGKWKDLTDDKVRSLFNCYPLFNGHSIKYMVYEPLLSFHSSWDWLQPCVEKCMNTKHPDRNAHMKLNDDWLSLNIDQVYKGVVNFIVTLQA